ncbi:MAG: class I SAM-dependent RNA methyltransferase [Rhodospirillaceae bacterium]|nr:class I SAM-dependent RNA methyltransferase [Rhodospirillaceae bacterium]
MAADLVIHELGPLGDGIHRAPGGPVYVERALPGETVQANVRAGSGGVLRGTLTNLVTASPHRVPAPCPHYDVCGGCALQHADDAFYRDWKLENVRSALRKKALEPRVWNAPIFVPPATRRRATFVAVKKNKAVTLGYFRRRSHDVTNISTCLVLDPALMDLRARLAPALVPILHGGKPADVFIQTVNGHCEVVITGAVGQKGRPDLQVYEAVAELAHALKLARVAWRETERDEPEVLVEVSALRASFGALDVALPPLAFLQPTAQGEAALVRAVMDLLPESGRFADLFSGCGTFSGPMLGRGPVDAYENSAPALAALDKAKGAKPLRALARDLFREPLTADEAARYDAVVFDPPRAGAQAQAVALAGSKVPIIVGVSCNPGTFARDARILVDGGHALDSVGVVDQFTWSHHVELVAGFKRRA